MANVYVGFMTKKREFRVTKNGRPFSHRRSLRVWNHSPDGFAWGYGGSGPAQLAFALLLSEGLSVDEASRLHQAFKWAVIARFPDEPGASWKLDTGFILDWVTRQREVDLVDLSEQADA